MCLTCHRDPCHENCPELLAARQKPLYCDVCGEDLNNTDGYDFGGIHICVYCFEERTKI